MHGFKQMALIISSSLVLGMMNANAQVYRWKDASGRTIYGDMPPKTSSVEEVNLPHLTIADGYKTKEVKVLEPAKTAQPEEISEGYENFAVASPAAGEALRSNSGSVAINLTLEPALKAGHSVVLYVDGKQYANGESLSYELSNMDRGSHSVFAVIKNTDGDIIQNTESVSFSVLRAIKRRRSSDEASI